MNTFILSLQLLTRIPIKKQIDVKDDMLIRGVNFYPVIGVVVGLFDVLIFWLFSLFMPKMFAALCAVLAELCITGGFHLDGLSDTADAIYSARTKERMLEIMKDTRVGSNGVIASVMDMLFKFILISTSRHTIAALILGPVAGKMVQSLLMYKAVYPREKGLGHSYIGRVTGDILMISSLSGFIIMTVGMIPVARWFAPVFPVACFLLAIGYRRYIESKIDGMTGDTLGAGSEIMEIFFLILFVAFETTGLIH